MMISESDILTLLKLAPKYNSQLVSQLVAIILSSGHGKSSASAQELGSKLLQASAIAQTHFRSTVISV